MLLLCAGAIAIVVVLVMHGQEVEDATLGVQHYAHTVAQSYCVPRISACARGYRCVLTRGVQWAVGGTCSDVTFYDMAECVDAGEVWSPTVAGEEAEGASRSTAHAPSVPLAPLNQHNCVDDAEGVLAKVGFTCGYAFANIGEDCRCARDTAGVINTAAMIAFSWPRSQLPQCCSS
jgi:hypothetical protein